MRKNSIVIGAITMLLLITVSVNVLAQSITVRGVVSDENGPVPGVTVTEKGKANATTTDSEGRFFLNVSSSKSVLVFSSIGFTTREVTVGSNNNISVMLEKSSQELSGVVVTALGITRAKKSLGYSVEEVAGKEMSRVAQENVLNAMSGKVAGVTINQTGAAGSSVSMVIRGATSLSSDNQPLFVIDGVPVANTLNNVTEVGSNNRVDYGNAIGGLNPDDIENVSILKGPSAAALYGSRAGNGVVLITTKSGKGLKKLTVSFTSNNVFEKPYKFLKWQTRFATGVFPATPVGISGNILTDPLGYAAGAAGSGLYNLVIDESSSGAAGPELDKG